MRAQLTLAILGLLLLPATVAAQATPTMRPGDNGMDTSFAKITMDPRPPYGGPDSPIEARILLKNDSGMQDAFILMFGFNGLSDAVDVKMDDLAHLRGADVPWDRDDRGSSLRQPKVWVRPDNVSFGQELVMRGRVTAYGNGQFHVGAIVIAFDKDYKKLATPAGEFAEVYAFGLLRAVDVDAGPGRPPFQGQGNVPLPFFVVLAALVVAVTAHRWRP